MAASQTGVEVILEDFSTHPLCSHGPTLLFERFTSGKKSGKRFFACSACRDRKDCSFFMWEDEGRKKAGRSLPLETSVLSRKELHSRLEKVKQLNKDERKFCLICNSLMLDEDDGDDDVSVHSGHHHKVGIKDTAIKRPSTFLIPLENSKKEAQYLFSEKATGFLYKTLQSLGFSKVICIGCPRLHDYITSKDESLESLLLDIDSRYEQFYPPSHYCQYNMFNHHFFRTEERSQYESFLSESDADKLVIVTDPPFGGLVEVVASTLKKIENEWKELTKSERSLSLLWIFPYFMEPRLKECYPSLIMLDYKVEYDNHELYRGGNRCRNRGSPVRIFTNVSPAKIVLPKNEGYKLCDICNRYVSVENEHCDKCNSCPSKDGRQYTHCDLCGFCVKPARLHCSTCKTCCPADHKCDEVKGAGCHICKSVDHKRKDCPSRNKGPRNKKRRNK